MSVTSGVATGRVLRNEPLITIPRQIPKESPVTHAALSIERQLHVVRVRDNVAVVARAPVLRIFAKLGMRFEKIPTSIVPILELIRVVEQRILAPVHVEDRRCIGHAK